MKVVRSVAVFTVLALVTAGFSTAQEKAKSKGQLPSGWGKIGLSDEQKNKIYDIQKKHNAKVEELEKQIKEAKDKMVKERATVLTAEQKTKLREARDSDLGEPDKDNKKG